MFWNTFIFFLVHEYVRGVLSADCTAFARKHTARDAGTEILKSALKNRQGVGKVKGSHQVSF